MQNQLDTIKQTPVMTWKDMPVCTTEMLAQSYGTKSDNIRMNFKNNRSKFVAGKHYITLEGNELKEFRGRVSEVYAPMGGVTESNAPFAPSPLARVVNLWTERGAARHAKLLDTDQAWEVFEALEDSYFQRRVSNSNAPAETPQLPATLTPEQYEAERDRLEAMQDRLASTPITILPEHYEQLMGEHIRVGKKTWLVTDLIGVLEEHGIPREITEELTGHNRNTIRQHAFLARKRNQH